MVYTLNHSGLKEPESINNGTNFTQRETQSPKVNYRNKICLKALKQYQGLNAKAQLKSNETSKLDGKSSNVLVP